MQIKRTALAAIVIAAAAAPNASAMVADGTGTKPAAQQSAEPAHDSTRFAEMLALRNSLRGREWPQGASAPVVPLVHPDADGLDWSSALIGATVPLGLLLAGVLARPALTRRRTRTRHCLKLAHTQGVQGPVRPRRRLRSRSSQGTGRGGSTRRTPPVENRLDR